MTLTPEELRKLLAAIDLAIRGGGLDVARELVPLAERIEAALAGVA